MESFVRMHSPSSANFGLPFASWPPGTPAHPWIPTQGAAAEERASGPLDDAIVDSFDTVIVHTERRAYIELHGWTDRRGARR
jgi:hypothetical protein